MYPSNGDPRSVRISVLSYDDDSNEILYSVTVSPLEDGAYSDLLYAKIRNAMIEFGVEIADDKPQYAEDMVLWENFTLAHARTTHLPIEE